MLFLLLHYNILNIAVNTEHNVFQCVTNSNYNILNIAVNTEHTIKSSPAMINYNILNIAVNTEQIEANILANKIITY